MSERFVDLSNTERVALVYDELLTKLGDQLTYNDSEENNPKFDNLPILKVPIKLGIMRNKNKSTDKNDFNNYDIHKVGEKELCVKLDAEAENMMVNSDFELFTTKNEKNFCSRQNSEQLSNEEICTVNKDGGRVIEINKLHDVSREIDKISVNNQTLQMQRVNTVLGPNPSKAASSALAWMNSAFTDSSKMDPQGNFSEKINSIKVDSMILHEISDNRIFENRNINNNNNNDCDDNEKSNEDNDNDTINKNKSNQFENTENHLKKEEKEKDKDKLVKINTRPISSRPGTSDSRKTYTPETVIDNDVSNIGITAFQSAPVRNKIGTYFGHNMSKLDVFRYLPATKNPLTFIIEAKTPQQWKSGKDFFMTVRYLTLIKLYYDYMFY